MAKGRDKNLVKTLERGARGDFEAEQPSPMEEALKESTDKAPASVATVPEPSSPAAKPAPKPAKPTQPPTPPVAIVPLEVFRQVSGVKPDQFAGFAWYAKRQGLTPQPVASWRKEYERFLTRAVG